MMSIEGSVQSQMVGCTKLIASLYMDVGISLFPGSPSSSR